MSLTFDASASLVEKCCDSWDRATLALMHLLQRHTYAKMIFDAENSSALKRTGVIYHLRLLRLVLVVSIYQVRHFHSSFCGQIWKGLFSARPLYQRIHEIQVYCHIVREDQTFRYGSLIGF